MIKAALFKSAAWACNGCQLVCRPKFDNIDSTTEWSVLSNSRRWDGRGMRRCTSPLQQFQSSVKPWLGSLAHFFKFSLVIFWGIDLLNSEHCLVKYVCLSSKKKGTMGKDTYRLTAIWTFILCSHRLVIRVGASGYYFHSFTR